jgi:hypothetical protein
VTALASLLLAYCAASGLSNISRSLGWLHDIARPDAVLTQRSDTPVGWLEVASVIPGGAADTAGIEPGDRVSFASPLGCCPANRPVAVAIEREGARHQATIVATRSAFAAPALLSVGGIGTLMAAAFALVLLVRGRDNRTAALLGMVLLSFVVGRSPAYPWSPNEAVVSVWLMAELAGAAAYGYLWPLFALAISGGAASARQAKLVRAVAFVSALLAVASSLAAGVAVYVPVFGSPAVFDLVFVTAHQAFGYAIIVSNYPRNDAVARNRIKIVVGAFVCFMISAQLGRIMGLLLAAEQYTQTQAFWIINTLNLLTYSALALLAYAVLRQRLFDLNFALNRTLVYGAVSFVLLAGFGLAKWVIEHLIPESWHAGSEYYSVGIALGLFLVLHRVHDGVERNVERFVFSPWHRNEETLRRFVTAAGHFDRTEVLCSAFAEELRRFSGGAGVAVYRRDRSGAYALQCGTLPGTVAHLRTDDLAFALMRAERGPVRLTGTQTSLPGALALPMLDHGKLSGFVLLGRKGNGADYRPDEVELLDWAAHQVGLDLQAMHAGELEAEVASLSAQVAALSAQLAAARSKRRVRDATGSAA